MKSGIYTITNVLDGKMYVGLALDVSTRLRKHREYLKRGNHANIRLQRAWNKYGENSFRFELLEEWVETMLFCMEHYWATLLNTHDENYGYNIKPTNPYGYSRLSEETKKKISISNKGKKRSTEAKEKTAAAHKGSKRTEDTKRKISEKQKGKVISQETREKLRKAHTGRKQGPEVVKRRQESNKGRVLSEETKKKISNKLKGHPVSEENRIKLSLLYKGVSKWTEEQRKEIGNRQKGIKRSEETKQKMKEAWLKRRKSL